MTDTRSNISTNTIFFQTAALIRKLNM